MVTCDECQDILQEYIDEELSAAEKSGMDAHIESCEECKRLHRKMAQFTTTMFKAVSPIQPAHEFASKIMAQLPDPLPPSTSESSNAYIPLPPEKTYPVWPIALGIAALVLIGLFLMFPSTKKETIGHLAENSEGVRVLVYEGHDWVEYSNKGSVPSEAEIESGADNSGNLVTLNCKQTFGSRITLQAPFRVRIIKENTRLLIMINPSYSGKLLVETGLRTDKKGTIRVTIGEGRAYASVKSHEKNILEITHENMLTASLKKGAARVGNLKEHARLSEMFTIEIPASGKIPLPSKVDADRFDWVELD